MRTFLQAPLVPFSFLLTHPVGRLSDATRPP